jgi:predicted nucleic acid binding AN1-type Zn finger protein
MSNFNEASNFGLLVKYPHALLKKKEPVKKECIDVEKKKKKKKKKKKTYIHKCNVCKKKISIVQQQLTCKCGLNFCSKHRLQQQHDCPVLTKFDPEQHKKKCGLGGGKFKQIEVL